MSKAILADKLRDCIANHKRQRRKNRVIHFLLMQHSVGIFVIVGGFLLIGVYFSSIAHVGGGGRNFMLLIFGCLGFFAFAMLNNLCNRRFGYRKHPDIEPEQSLIEMLESGKPFGLYLRPFGPFQKMAMNFFNWANLDKILGELNTCRFFALDELQRDISMHVPSIWYPMDKWQEIAFPLIKEAAVVIIDLDVRLFEFEPNGLTTFGKAWNITTSPVRKLFDFMDGVPSGHIGIVEELAFISENDFMQKTILIYTQSIPLRKGWGAEIASYAAKVPCVLTSRNEARLRDRIDMLVNEHEMLTTGVS